jgi:hypothetical protein
MACSEAERNAFLDRYATGPGVLRAAWEATPSEARRWRPAAGKWSAHEVVVHCADSETFAASRIRLLLADPEPLIVGYDENAWARRFSYHDSDPDLALDLIARVRDHTHRMLRSLPGDAWGRAGRHTHSGAYSTDDWLRIYAEHLEVHTAQIRRNMAAWRVR